MKECFASVSPTRCNLMDCSLPGSSVHGFFGASILGRAATPYSGGSSRCGGQARISCCLQRWQMGSFPLVPHGKESASRAGDAGDLSSIPGLGRFPGGGCSNSLQDSCLKYPMDRGAWWATVYGVTKSQTQLK